MAREVRAGAASASAGARTSIVTALRRFNESEMVEVMLALFAIPEQAFKHPLVIAPI